MYYAQNLFITRDKDLETKTLEVYAIYKLSVRQNTMSSVKGTSVTHPARMRQQHLNQCSGMLKPASRSTFGLLILSTKHFIKVVQIIQGLLNVLF